MNKNVAWLPVVGYEGLYNVSDSGDVFSVRSARLLRPHDGGKGYLRVRLCRRGDEKLFHVHSLVLHAFARPPVDGEQARHLNGKRGDNRAVNLSWGTALDNVADRRGHGMDPIGSQNAHAKLTERQVLEIRSSGLRVRELASLYGVTRFTINGVLAGRSWKHVEGSAMGAP